MTVNRTQSLLPGHASALEHGLAALSTRINNIPIPIRHLQSPDLIEAKYLPYLAWAFSVDHWSEHWDEETKRAVIKSAIIVHRIKGTPAALRTALEALGLGVKMEEWFNYGGKPYHFRLEVDSSERGIGSSEIANIEAVALTTKNVRSKLESIKVYLTRRGPLYIAVAAQIIEDVTIYPKLATMILVAHRGPYLGISANILETITINRDYKTGAPAPPPAPGYRADHPIIVDLGKPVRIAPGNLFYYIVPPPGPTPARVFYFTIPKGRGTHTVLVSDRFPVGALIVITNHGTIDVARAISSGIATAFLQPARRLIIHNYGTIRSRDSYAINVWSNHQAQYYGYPGSVLRGARGQASGPVLIDLNAINNPEKGPIDE